MPVIVGLLAADFIRLSSSCIALMLMSWLAFAGESSDLSQPTSNASNIRLAIHNWRQEPGKVIDDINIVDQYPHDANAFTQGLLFLGGRLYESTGLYRQSRLLSYTLDGQVIQQKKLLDHYFAEGLAVFNDYFYQLTYKAGKVFIYDDQFEPIDTLTYPGEGWGLARYDHSLIMSNGSDQLVLRNPETFAEERRISVTFQGKPVKHLNELEVIGDIVLANIWQTPFIAVIDMANDEVAGQVIAWINLEKLIQLLPASRTYDVLNGIAYDHDQDRLFVTGKYWPAIFSIQFSER